MAARLEEPRSRTRSSDPSSKGAGSILRTRTDTTGVCKDPPPHKKEGIMNAATVQVPLAAARLLQSPRCSMNLCTTFVSAPSSSSTTDLGLVQRRHGLPPKRRLVIKATRTESKGVYLGFRAPDFQLSEPLTGRTWSLEDFEPYHALLKGLVVVAISSNSAVTHPQDGPQFMAEVAKEFNYPFPYLYDDEVRYCC